MSTSPDEVKVLHSKAVSPLICSTASLGVVQRWIIPQEQDTYCVLLSEKWNVSHAKLSDSHLWKHVACLLGSRLYFPHLISTVFDIFVRRDLNPTKLLKSEGAFSRGPRPGRPEGADLADIN